MQALLGIPVYSQGRRIAHIHDLLVDDALWCVTYAVLRMGHGLGQREKLVCPHVLQLDQARRTCDLSLSRQQLRLCPDPAADPSMSRQCTAHFARQQGTWLTCRLTSWLAQSPVMLNWLMPLARRAAAKILSPRHPIQHPITHKSHLRSLREILGYVLFGTDGQIGNLCDFAFDHRHWRLIHAIVQPRACRQGLRGTPAWMLPVAWLVWLNWAFRRAHVNLPKSALSQIPNGNGMGVHAFDEQSVCRVTSQYLNLTWD